jgi:hypothetical protein
MTPRFTKRCPCGERLQLARNADLDVLFWNCFTCFPEHEHSSMMTCKRDDCPSSLFVRRNTDLVAIRRDENGQCSDELAGEPTDYLYYCYLCKTNYTEEEVTAEEVVA